MANVMRALGLMSGTSLDGVDVALIETDGANLTRRGPALTHAYTPAMRELLRQAMTTARALTRREERPGILAEAEAQLTNAHVAAVEQFLAQHGLPRDAIDVVGFHGQTVLHRPQDRLTVQIGDAARLADLTGIPVIFDLRAADVAAGGQGAPLVPVYHRALLAHVPQRPVAVVNIGGVSNVTFIGDDGRLIAFDTGPGNALIDDWMKRHTGLPCDKDGAAALLGRADAERVADWLAHYYFAGLPPKSLDRDAFDVSAIDGLSRDDGAATLTLFTAAAIAKAREHMPDEPQLWIVCGGGRNNRALMRSIAAAVENAVVPAEAVGWNGDSLEAEAWGYLAVRALKRLPITFPGTTGVAIPLTGGVRADPRVRH